MGTALEKIVQRDPEIHSGDLVFAGTRVPVDSLVGYLKGGHSIEEFLQDYPTVERWQLESYLDLSPQGALHKKSTLHKKSGFCARSLFFNFK